MLTINLYGTKPNRQVLISEPVIKDVVPPPPALYTVDESVAPGQRKQVDWEAEGMTVEVTRTLIENGETRTEMLVSKYQPWRAVYLVGSEADIPASARSAITDTVPVEDDSAAEATVEATVPVTAEITPAAEVTTPTVEGPDQ
jgi:hypothetical protein